MGTPITDEERERARLEAIESMHGKIVYDTGIWGSNLDWPKPHTWAGSENPITEPAIFRLVRPTDVM